MPCTKSKWCNALSGAIQLTKGVGLYVEDVFDIKKGKFSGSFVCVKSGDFAKKGIMLNYCPFCGKLIRRGWTKKVNHEPKT